MALQYQQNDDEDSTEIVRRMREERTQYLSEL